MMDDIYTEAKKEVLKDLIKTMHVMMRKEEAPEEQMPAEEVPPMPEESPMEESMEEESPMRSEVKDYFHRGNRSKQPDGGVAVMIGLGKEKAAPQAKKPAPKKKGYYA